MTTRQLLENYLDGKTDAISTIRAISGAFNPDFAVDLLALICAITRIEQGDLEKDLFRQLWMAEPASDN